MSDELLDGSLKFDDVADVLYGIHDTEKGDDLPFQLQFVDFSIDEEDGADVASDAG